RYCTHPCSTNASRAQVSASIAALATFPWKRRLRPRAPTCVSSSARHAESNALPHISCRCRQPPAASSQNSSIGPTQISGRSSGKKSLPSAPFVERFEWRYTPKHGSWLDMAESELAILSGQCLSRRIPDRATLEREVAAWVEEHNIHHAKADWRFTAADARIKLKSLYPSL